MLGAALGWQYRNAAYLLPLVPALALLAAAWGPSARRVTRLGWRSRWPPPS